MADAKTKVEEQIATLEHYVDDDMRQARLHLTSIQEILWKLSPDLVCGLSETGTVAYGVRTDEDNDVIYYSSFKALLKDKGVIW